MTTSIRTKISIASATMSAVAMAGSTMVADNDMSKVLLISGLSLTYLPGKQAVDWLLRDEGYIASALLRRKD